MQSVFESHKLAESFSEELSKTLSSICSCDVPPSDVADVYLVCVDKLPNAKVFQGSVRTSSERNLSQLAEDIRRVAIEKKSITLLGKEFVALDNCTCCNIITESDLGSESAAENCISASNGGGRSGLSSGQWAGIGTAIFIGMIILLTVIALVWCWRQRQPQPQ